MTIAQCKAARRNMKNDTRYKPKKGLRKNVARAEARNRKRVNAGMLAGSIGYSKK